MLGLKNVDFFFLWFLGCRGDWLCNVRCPGTLKFAVISYLAVFALISI